MDSSNFAKRDIMKNKKLKIILKFNFFLFVLIIFTDHIFYQTQEIGKLNATTELWCDKYAYFTHEPVLVHVRFTNNSEINIHVMGIIIRQNLIVKSSDNKQYTCHFGYRLAELETLEPGNEINSIINLNVYYGDTPVEVYGDPFAFLPEAYSVQFIWKESQHINGITYIYEPIESNII